MGCYDCEVCLKSTKYGGKCKRFEYICPFLIVEKYDSEELKSIREAINKISQAIGQLRELDTKDCMEEEVNSISFQLSLLEDAVDEDMEKEWNEIAMVRR